MSRTGTFRHWLSLEISHGYFDQGECKVFQLIPLSDTGSILKNYGIRLRPMNNRYLMYVEGDASKKWEDILPTRDLYFQLINTDPYFRNYTANTSAKEEDNLLYLTNKKQAPLEMTDATEYLPMQGLRFTVDLGASTPVVVQVKKKDGEEIFNETSMENQQVMIVDLRVYGTGIYELWINGKWSKNFIGSAEAVQEGCFGLVHLQMPLLLPLLGGDNILGLSINFEVRQVYWQYHVIVAEDKKINIKNIIVEGVDGAPFSGPEMQTIGAQKARIFTSPEPLKLQEKATRSPLLKMQYTNDFSDTVLDMDIKMPLPSITNMKTKIEPNGNSFYSQIIVYV
ncbi:hypothetical protein [Spongiimicrobium salis]|uniref:hypothetical protein n=1 Tax=Spongiimicrobium salis TaxID=1667022 RepID=UPI00374CA202